MMSVQALPPELLLPIIKGATESVDTVGMNPVPVYTTLSHVCRRWREIAVTCQDLWTIIPQKNRSWTELCLSRCTSAPLVLLFPLPLAPMAVFETTYPHLSRVKCFIVDLRRGLHRRGTHQAIIDHMAFILRGHLRHLVPTPPLERLHILLDTNSRGFPVPTHLRNLEFLYGPTLNELTLSNIVLSRISDVQRRSFSNLRSLTFRNTTAWTDMDEMLMLLEAVPLLQDYWHTGAGLLPEGCLGLPDSLPAPGTVRLGHLRALHLESTSNLLEAYVLFSCLAFPSVASLHIGAGTLNAAADGLTMEQYTALLERVSDALRSHFAGAFALKAYYHAVRLGDDAVCTLDRDSYQWPYGECLPSPGELYLQLPLHRPLPFNDPLGSLDQPTSRAVFGLPIFTYARRVVLNHAVGLRFANARIVELESEEDIRTFTGALIGGFAAGASANIAALKYPALECIRIIGIGLDEDGPCMSAIGLIGLLHWIYANQEGMRLVLHRCEISEGGLRKIRESMHPWPVHCEE